MIIELAGQTASDRAIPWLQGFGVAVNYTYVDTSASRDTDTGATECGYPGLSRQSYNSSVFFENGKFQARASYNWRAHGCWRVIMSPSRREWYSLA